MSGSSSGSGSPSDAAGSEPEKNKGTLIVDATCAPTNIRYPQDISLLNEAREKLETMLYRFCKTYGLPVPRCYAKKARKDYLTYAKARKHTNKQTRKAIKKHLSYVRRDLAYLEKFMSEGYAPVNREIPLLQTIMKLYGQQQYCMITRSTVFRNALSVSISHG